MSKLLGPAFPIPTPPIKKQNQVRWAGHVDVKRLLERTCSYGPQECTYNVATGGLPVSKDYTTMTIKAVFSSNEKMGTEDGFLRCNYKTHDSLLCLFRLY